MSILDIGIQKGITEGHASGLAEGIAALIESCQELGAAREVTRMKIEQKLSITGDEAEKYMHKYWKD